MMVRVFVCFVHSFSLTPRTVFDTWKKERQAEREREREKKGKVRERGKREGERQLKLYCIVIDWCFQCVYGVNTNKQLGEFYYHFLI